METFKKIDNIVISIEKWLSYSAPIILIIMALIATVNVLTSKIFVVSVPGNIMWITYLLIPVTYFACPFEQSHRGFMTVDAFSSKYPKIGQQILQYFSDLFGAAIYALCGYAAIPLLRDDFMYKTLSETGSQGFVLWPFDLILIVMCFVLAFSFLWNIARRIAWKGNVAPMVLEYEKNEFAGIEAAAQEQIEKAQAKQKHKKEGK